MHNTNNYNLCNFYILIYKEEIMNHIFTDLACEIADNTVESNKKSSYPTHIFRQKISENIEKQTINFENVENKRSIIYFTPQIWEINDVDFFLLQSKMSDDISSMVTEQMAGKNDIYSVLTVGLGNPFFSTDSLGPETVKNIKTGLQGAGKRRVYSIVPDVEINTGIESTKYILAMVNSLRPNLVIVIDSLAARSIYRLASTVQISNYGLSPGSGLGRSRQQIDKETLGIPVISIGIPTVANLSSFMYGDTKKSDDIEKRKKYFITPKEIELIIKSGAILLSETINKAFWGN